MLWIGGYWRNDSSITVRIPEGLYWYPDSAEFYVFRVPDSTGETIFPRGMLCDTFAFNRSAIPEEPLPAEFSLSAHPNPFNSAVNIVAPENTTIEIFDINGKHIAKLSKNESIWRPPECVSSGIYLIQVKNGMNSVSKRVLYIK